MKRVCLFLMLFAISFQVKEISAQQKKPSLKGVLLNYTASDSIELLDALDQKRNVIERAFVDSKGNFTFHYSPNQIGYYVIQVPAGKHTLIVLSPKTTSQITIDPAIGALMKVENSKENALLKRYQDCLMHVEIKKDSLMKAYQVSPDPNLSDVLREMEKEKITFLEQLCLDNKTNYASAALLEDLTMEEYFPVYDAVLSELIKIYPDDILIKDLFRHMNAEKKLAIGSPAPEISLPDVDGKMVSLSSFKGKVVLIDFWASWCGPCRRENPNMITLYNAFKDKGFEILGVSLDRDKNRWLEAIQVDGLKWTHISDLKQWASEAAGIYGVRSIPFTVLVGKDGKIIAKGLRGDALFQKVKEVLEK